MCLIFFSKPSAFPLSTSADFTQGLGSKIPPIFTSAYVLTITALGDVTARPGSRGPAQAEPCEAKLYEAPAGLPGAHGSGFTFLKPQAVA